MSLSITGGTGDNESPQPPTPKTYWEIKLIKIKRIAQILSLVIASFVILWAVAEIFWPQSQLAKTIGSIILYRSCIPFAFTLLVVLAVLVWSSEVLIQLEVANSKGDWIKSDHLEQKLKKLWRLMKLSPIVLLLLILFIFMAYKVTEAISAPQVSQVTTTIPAAQVDPTRPSPFDPNATRQSPTVTVSQPLPNTPKAELGWGMIIFTSFVFLLLTAFVGFQVVQESKTNNTRDWGKVVTNPTIYAVIAVLGINAFLAIGLTDLWISFWEETKFFFIANFGLIVMTHFLKKEGGGYKLVGALIGLIILASGYRTYASPSFIGWSKPARPVFTAKANTAKGDYLFGPDRVPAEIALKVIGSCESTGQPNKEPVHYEKDGRTLLRNREGSSARGMYQMMPDHWIDAKKLGYDLEKEADYRAYAINLYNRTGTKHWEFDSHKGGGPACWGNTLAQIAKEPNFSYTLKIRPPVEEFGAETTVPDGYNYTWGESKGSFVVKNQVGSQARYDRKKKLLEDLPGYSKRLVFKSLDKNPEEIILKLERAIR